MRHQLHDGGASGAPTVLPEVLPEDLPEGLPVRVIAGSARGRTLTAPPGRDTRPTSDRVREAMFSSLADVVPGAVVLDLYAGSGALAIEALSRGADAATLVEHDRRAASAIEANLAAAGVADRATLHRTTAERFCAAPSGGPFHLVLLDPPYAITLPAVWARVADLHEAGALATGAVVVVERDKRDPHLEGDLPRFLAPDRRRSYGDTVLLYVRAT